MNDKDILQKAIKKAEKNGFDYSEWQYKNTNIPLYGMMEGNIKELLKTNYYKLLLFDSDFAKAFWGEECCGDCYETSLSDCSGIGKYCKACGADYIIIAWKFQLQHMILEEEPLKYLEKSLEV